MIYCTNCGQRTEPGTNFCSRCGAKMLTESFQQPPSPIPPPPQTVYQPVPYVAPQGTEQAPPPPQLRLCSKCGVSLENDILFCPVCGTKNYVFQTNKTRKGELLIVLENCSLVKLQILKNSGTLLLFDDRIVFQANASVNNLTIGYAEVTGVVPHNVLNTGLCMKISCSNGKSYVFGLSEADADFYYYVINFITDYRY